MRSDIVPGGVFPDCGLPDARDRGDRSLFMVGIVESGTVPGGACAPCELSMFSFVRRRRAAKGSRTVTASCSHLDSVKFTKLPKTIAGCEECLASGGWWVHLRMCHSCGHTSAAATTRPAGMPPRTPAIWATPSSAPLSLARTGATAT
jgi:hypothetical protein